MSESLNINRLGMNSFDEVGQKLNFPDSTFNKTMEFTTFDNFIFEH